MYLWGTRIVEVDSFSQNSHRSRPANKDGARVVNAQWDNHDASATSVMHSVDATFG